MIRLLLLCLCLFVGQGAIAQDSDQPSGTIAIEDSADRDAAIAVRIREILAELEGYEDVTVAVSSGIVTMRGTTLDSAAAARLNALAGRVEGVVAIENEVTETADVVARLDPAMQRFAKRTQQFFNFLPLVGVALTAFAAVVFVGIVIARWRQPWDRIAPNAFIADIFRQIIRLAFLVAGVVVALDILGATALLSTILGAAGIIGLAIGFAVRDTVENFIASVMLSIRQPFRPNDTVEIEGDIGKVIRLTSRATILLSFDGNHIRIPNATVFKSRIVNYSRNDERRFLLDLGVAYDTDLAAAQALALRTVEDLPFVLDAPAPSVWLEGLGDSAVNLKVAAWIAQHDTSFVAAKGEAYRLCMAAFEAAGVAMPGPTYTILTQPGSAMAAQSARPSDAPQRPPKVAAPPEVQDVTADAELELEQIIETERADGENEDLLSRHSPEE